MAAYRTTVGLDGVNAYDAISHYIAVLATS